MKRPDPHLRTSYLIGLCLLGGMLGGLANGAAAWIFGLARLNRLLGVAIFPSLDWPWIAPRLLWGGLWGIPFALGVRDNWERLPLTGLVYSLLPTVNQLFYVFPFLQNKGTAGIALGKLTFLPVLLFNAVWGLALAGFVKMAARDR